MEDYIDYNFVENDTVYDDDGNIIEDFVFEADDVITDYSTDYLDDKPSAWHYNMSTEQKKAILNERIYSMSAYDRAMFLKIIREDAIDELLDAMKNLKNTAEETWKNIIYKLQNLLNFKDDDTSKFDFNKILKVLLPLVAALAALLLALKKAEKAESEASNVPSDIENDPVFKALYNDTNNDDDDGDIDKITGKIKSIVLTNCKKEIDGFSS